MSKHPELLTNCAAMTSSDPSPKCLITRYLCVAIAMIALTVVIMGAAGNASILAWAVAGTSLIGFGESF